MKNFLIFISIYLFSFNYVYSFLTELKKRIETIEGNNENCIITLTNFSEHCVIITDKLNDYNSLKEFCYDFNSEFCQDIYSTKISNLEECKGIMPKMNIDDNSLSLMYNYFTLYCSRDEDNNICPYIIYMLKKKFEKSQEKEYVPMEEEKDYIEVVKRTCNSKQCTDSMINFSNNLKKFNLTNDNSEKKNKRDEIFSIPYFENLGEDKRITEASEYLQKQCSVEKTDSSSPSSYSSSFFLGFFIFIFLSLILV